MTTAAERYAELLNAAVQPAYAERFPNLDGVRFYADKGGRKFTRIVKEAHGSRSVHAFVENATGYVYKAEGWKAPAKGVRYTSVEAAVEAMSKTPDRQYGGTGYLYR